MTREAIRHCLNHHDRGLPADELTHRLMSINAVTSPAELIGAFHSQASRSHWARQAQAIFLAASQGHTGSLNIIDRSAEALKVLVLRIIDAIGLPGPVVFGGGLALHQPKLQAALGAALQTARIHDVRFLNQDPVKGARFLAGTGSSHPLRHSELVQLT